MAEDRVSAPQSSAGLVRYYDVTSSKVRITPEIVVGFSVLVIVIEIIFSRLLK
jgi:preprotein translocase subunit Sec61beta